MDFCRFSGLTKARNHVIIIAVGMPDAICIPYKNGTTRVFDA